MKIEIPELSLVALVGVSGSGKSTFARRHFRPTEVISSDVCRGLVSDDESDQSASADAFDVLHYIAGKRLARGRLTVIDATNVEARARKAVLALAREHDVLPVAIVLDIDPRVCEERNRARADRDVGARVIRQQHAELRRSLRRLQREGFRRVFVLDSPEAVETATVERTRLWNDRRDDHGPFDIIGDVHGCHEELCALLERLGYSVSADGARHPEGRRAIFLGDLVDRGPASPAVLRLAMGMVAAGDALCVPGNHEIKLLKKLRGRNVRVSHGLAETLAQLEAEPEAFRARVADFIDGLVSHYVLDDGRLVVAHAGLSERLQGRASGRVRQFALYGETTGETDELGLPVRYPWANDYRGRAMVVYGHTPVPEPVWVNRTICIDTGCVFGGRLTALRYPEKELVSVPARQVWYEPIRPLAAPAGEGRGDLLDYQDVGGKRIIETRVRHTVTIREENAAAALEVMSRFAADPRWVIYLPPTMSPSETCPEGDALERPAEAFEYYARHGVEAVVCEEKHMGSRAVVVLCGDAEAARRRFGVDDGRAGVVYTRTGRPFFADRALEDALLDRVRRAMDAAGFWERFETDWICLDAELMPWSLKAGELLRSQYAAVGAAGGAALDAAVAALRRAAERGAADPEVLGWFEARRAAIERYQAAWRRYCWPAERVEDLRLAPFHLLATEGRVHIDRPHPWHMETLAQLCAHDEVLMATPFRVVDLADTEARRAATGWWEALTGAGGEGMVVKPLDWLARGRRGLVQPALKCRGREYLRIIYGPEYTHPAHLARLRERGLSRKRSLALREYALGLEALFRFVEREPLYRVHECVFGVLALESEPVDPRL